MSVRAWAPMAARARLGRASSLLSRPWPDREALRRAARTVQRDLHGHYWTYDGFVRSLVSPPVAPLATPWSAIVDDPVVGPVTLSGDLAIPEDARDVVIVLHGMGGAITSRYVVLSARAAHARGMAVLRLHMRGADHSGTDVYHAGLTDDLRAAIASPELARFERIHVIGHSLGGHVALRFAAEGDHDPRLAAVVALCAPVDLHEGVRAIQRVDRRPYQFHVLRAVKSCYREVAARRPMPVPLEEVMAARTVLEWDERVVCPRFGFASALDYYERAGVASMLHRIDVPTLYVGAEADPMIPEGTVRPALDRASRAVEAAWVDRGGHLGFPAGTRAKVAEGETLDDEIAAWLVDRR